MALAVIERAGDDRHGAVLLEMEAAHLVARRRGDLEVAADAAAAELACLAAVAQPRLVAAPIGDLERLREQRREIAAVVDGPGRGRPGQLLRRDQVAPPQGRLVDPHFRGGRVDQPLHEVISFRPPGAAIGADRRGVGDDALRLHLDVSGVRYMPMLFLPMFSVAISGPTGER